MILYLAIIGVCWLLYSGLFALVLRENYFSIFAWIGAGIALTIVIDGFTATIARLMPPPKERAFFQVSLKEKNFYEKMRIRQWKDKVPEIGHYTGFRKNRLAEPNNARYVQRFLLESRYGEIGHIASCFTAALIPLAQLLAFVPRYWWALCIVVCAVNAILNLLTVFVLRYNYYKLSYLHKALIKKEGKQLSIATE